MVNQQDSKQLLLQEMKMDGLGIGQGKSKQMRIAIEKATNLHFLM